MRPQTRNALLHALLIVVLGSIAYANSFHVPFSFDDESSIVHNQVIRSPANFLSNDSGYRYNPRRFVTYLTFALNYASGGLDVTGYHVVNLAIHLANGLLVYAFLRLTFAAPVMTRSAAPPVSEAVAALAAIPFVVHPLQTEAVTYIVQRATSLATMWALLSICAYVRARLLSEAGGRPLSRRAAWYAAAVAAAVLAMKSKEIAFTLPLLIALHEFTFFRAPLSQRILRLWPILLTLPVIPLGLIDAHAPLGQILSDVSSATRVQTTVPRWDYLLTQFRVLVTYLRLLLVPVGQNLDYDYPISRSLLAPQVLGSFLALASLFGAGCWLWVRSRRRSDGPLALVSYGILWFFVTLSPESSVIPIVDVIFEHRMYLPSVGLLAAIVVGAATFADRRLAEGGKKALLVVAMAWIACLCALTYARNGVWRNNVSLWRDVAAKSPKKARVFDSLGSAFFYENRFEDAIRNFEIATKLAPDDAHAYNNLGIAYGKMGLAERALSNFRLAVRYRPDYGEAYSNMGIAYEKLGMPDNAVEQFRTAIRVDPAYPDSYRNLGNAYMKMGRVDDAIANYNRAVALNPEDAANRNNLGIAYMKRGETEPGIRELERAVALDPGNRAFRANLEAAYSRRR